MTKVQRLQKKIGDLQDRIRDIQNDCRHPDNQLIVKHRGDTGNYDPSCDIYWTEYHCSVCDKMWSNDVRIK